MSQNVLNRTWLSPITAVTFAAVAVTGVLMFFEVRSRMLHGLHEWVGVAFAVAGLLHLILNWRVFVAYFRRPVAVASVVVGVALCVVVAMFAALGEEREHGHGPPSHEQRLES